MAKKVVEYDRESGIQAIIALQKMAGIDEPREKAERNWDAFSDFDKANTMAAAELFSGGEKRAATLPLASPVSATSTG